MNTKHSETGTAEELAEVLGLTPADAEEWEVQYALLKRLRKIVESDGFTHAEVAKRAGTSRTRVTAILNGNLGHVSTDLLIRLVRAVGYRVKISLSRIEVAA